MSLRRFFTVLLLSASFCASVPALAADKVTLRSSQNKGYSRLVAEWPAATNYTVSKDGNRILVRFAKAGKADAGGLEKDAKNIGKVDTISSAGEPLQIAITIPAGSRFRDFAAGSKFIVDVYDPDPNAKPKDDSKPEAAAKEEPKPKESPKAQTPVTASAPQKPADPVTPAKAVPSNSPSDVAQEPMTPVSAPSVPAAATPVAPIAATPTQPSATLKPYVLDLTSTTPFGLAVYRRGGTVLIVTDAATPSDVDVKMSSSGKHIPPPDGITFGEAGGYRVKIPAAADVAIAGGGLAWKIIAAPGKTPPSPQNVQPEIREKEGALFWPVKGLRKTIRFNDPVTGEAMVAVTAQDASQRARGGKYVDFDSVPALSGLVFAMKSDGVKENVTTSGVEVGRQGGGLTLSSVQDLGVQDKSDVNAPPAAPSAAAPSAESPSAAKIETAPAAETDASAEAPKDAPKEEAAPPVALPTPTAIEKNVNEKPSGNNLYNFSKWEMGGLQALDANQHAMMMDIAQRDGDARMAGILTMAKMLIANNRGAEALGLIRIVEDQSPALAENKEVIGLRGAALALAGKYDDAFVDLGLEKLAQYDDVKYWKAFALAGLEDWKQAGETLAKDILPVGAYPKAVRVPLLLSFAEIALRSGDEKKAQSVLDMIKADLPTLALPYVSSWHYLQGETDRQAGDLQGAEAEWKPLATSGKDDLFRAKAGLSLTKLELDEKKIKPADAIDRLESLRYAWRGDELEALVNFRLGQMYIGNKDYLKGLTVLRNASELMPGTQIGTEISGYTNKTFQDIFTGDAIDTLSPLDAIRIHDEFKDMIPKGEAGAAYAEKLAERLVDADLLGRAASLLDYQIANNLTGDRKAGTAIRAAAIRLLDGNPDGALRSLDVAQATLDKMNGVAPPASAPSPSAADAKTAETPADKVEPQAGDAKPDAKAAVPPATAMKLEKADPEKQRQIYLLRARALSMQKKSADAMAILDAMDPDPDVDRLRADIAWTAGNWQEAGSAFGDLITAEDISSKRPLSDYQRDIIFNRAIALNLSNDRIALSNLRERFNAQMTQTNKGAMFEVVTRPRRPDMVGSREAISGMISEIDLFQSFLDDYAKMGAAPPKTPAPAVDEKGTAPASDAKAADAAAAPDASNPAAEKAKAEEVEQQDAKTSAPSEKIPGDETPAASKDSSEEKKAE